MTLRFLFLLALFTFTARTEEVEIPHRVSSSAFCEAVLNRMEVYGLEKNPDESHEQLANNFLASFKTELGIYQIKPDRRLSNKSISSAKAKQADRARVAARIDGIFTDDETSHRAYLHLEGREKIESFFAEVLGREQLLSQAMRENSGQYLRRNELIYRLGTASAVLGLATDFKYLASKIFVAIVAARLFTEKTEGRRLSRRFDQKLMLPLADFKSGWHYSGAAFSVNMGLRCPTYGDLPIEVVAGTMRGDHRNYLDCLLGWFFQPNPQALNGFRYYVAIDQFYRWDDLTQEPELVVVFRHYKEKPKNPKSETPIAKAKREESSFRCAPEQLGLSPSAFARNPNQACNGRAYRLRPHR